MVNVGADTHNFTCEGKAGLSNFVSKPALPRIFRKVSRRVLDSEDAFEDLQMAYGDSPDGAMIEESFVVTFLTIRE